MNPLAPPTSRRVATTILEGFERHFSIFQKASKLAQTCFEQCNWLAIRKIVKQRIYFYERRVKESVTLLQRNYDLESFDGNHWAQIKLDFIELITNHNQAELAESFYNSVFCHLFTRKYYNNQYIFVRPSVSTAYVDLHEPVINVYCIKQHNAQPAFIELLNSFNLQCSFEDFDRDIERLTQTFYQKLNASINADGPIEFRVLKSAFFRHKTCYIIARIITEKGITQPMCIVLLNDKGRGLYVDAILMEKAQLSKIFSFTRAYFLLHTEMPFAVIDFLKTLMPDKTNADLYSMIGFHKHGKTLLYRMFLRYNQANNEMLNVAPGITGMVMLVFTFPVYPYVFKLIRDHFRPPKETNRDLVKKKYRIVKNHERIGRMADTWEFSNIAFPIKAIAPELLDELQREAASSIEVDGEWLIIKHLYIEKKMQPLNLYIQQCNEAQIEYIVKDFGNAIKDLIHANIFPGDMLPKNFGVTQHNHVVFYDYDEITYMDEVNFRAIPEPQTHEQEMASEPWYHVGEADVFPEEFLSFLFSNVFAKKMFIKHHKDLLTPSYWKSVQAKVNNKEIHDVFSYEQSHRMLSNFPKKGVPS